MIAETAVTCQFSDLAFRFLYIAFVFVTVMLLISLRYRGKHRP